MLDPIGKEETTDPVLFPDAGQREDGGNLDGAHGARHRVTDPGRSRQIDHQQEGEFPFLGERFDEGRPEPGRDVPVDGAVVVPALVRPDLGEFHPLPAEHRARLAREQGIDHTSSPKGDPLDLLQQFGRDPNGHGTFTFASTCSTIASLVTSSASASKDNTIRWRRTSGARAWMSCGVT